MKNYTTQGYIFIKATLPHKTVIVWEQADISDMLDDMNYVFVGTCLYDMDNNYIQTYEGR